MTNEIRFNDAVVERNIDAVMKLDGVSRYTISYEAINSILNLFGVATSECVEDIRAIRNSVVKYFRNLRKDWYTEDRRNYTDKYDFDTDMKYSMWVSAITAALDSRIFDIDPYSV